MTQKRKNPVSILDWLDSFSWRWWDLGSTREYESISSRVKASVEEPKTSDAERTVKSFIGPALAFTGQGKPVTPEAAKEHALSQAGAINQSHLLVAIAMVAAELASLGQLDYTLAEFMDLPFMQAHRNIARSVWETEFQYGYDPLFRRYWLKKYLPMIPPAPDLIQMVVREAFDPKVVVEAPAVFTTYMAEAGYSKEWCDRYWTAHFLPMDIRQAYENLWRKDDWEAEFKRWMIIADIHPMWHQLILDVAFRPPGVREMGYGYDTGEYSVEDIVKYRRWGGLSPEDAEKAGKAMVAYRTEAEREALRREAIADFQAWLDDEPQLRVNLGAIGGRPEIIDLWVERAKYRRERDYILDMVKVSVEQFIKGHINEAGLRQDLIELGIVPEGREKIMKEVKARRLKAVREEVAEKKKVMPEGRVRLARDLGLISDPEYVRRLIDHGWLEEDAKLDLAIELTPKPVTPEEIERRQRTVTSKLARARRRWEDRLARAANQIELTELQRDDAGTAMAESLDVIDTQIAIIDAEVPVVTPEVAEKLLKDRIILVQRRELTEARFMAQIRKLTEQHTDLTEQRALMEKHRDEELGEYEEELRLVGGVAG